MSESLENSMQEHAEKAATMLKQMSSPARLMILCALVESEMAVNELNERIQLSQSALSQHLAKLREAKLVSTRKEKQTVFYRLKGKEVIQIIGVLKNIYCPTQSIIEENSNDS